MRLIYFTSVRLPSEKAHAIQIYEMCNAFSGNFDVLLVTPKRFQSNRVLRETSVEEYFGPCAFEVYTFNCVDELSPRWPGYRYVVGLGFLLRLIWSVFFLKLRVVRPCDIIFTREWWPAVFMRLLGLNVVYEAHQFNTSSLTKNAVLRGFRLLRFARKTLPLVTISSRLASSFRQIGFTQILVAHDAVNESLIGTEADESASKQKLYDVVYTGHLFPEKGVDLVIHIASSFPDLKFCIVGGLPDDVERLQSLASRLGADNVEFIGLVDPMSAREFQRQAKVLILPQRDETAQSPLKLFEYMASGVPTIVSGTRPICEVFKEENHGAVFEPGNLADLTHTLASVLMNYEGALQKARTARVFVKENHTWAARADLITKFIRKEYL